MSLSTPSHSAPWFLADHPALDFINTVMMQDGQAQECLHTNEDVVHWLAQAGLDAETTGNAAKPGALLKEALLLREAIRQAVAQRKAGNAIETAAINRCLAAARVHQQLFPDEAGALQLTRRFTAKNPVEMLAPLAEQAALLLADPHFSLVKACEHPDCTLWFYDRTKAHRRRWCSMALCGNRAKVARFREQKKEG